MKKRENKSKEFVIQSLKVLPLEKQKANNKKSNSVIKKDFDLHIQ